MARSSHPSRSSWRSDPTTPALLGLALSLGVVTLLVHLPLHRSAIGVVGWRTTPSEPAVAFETLAGMRTASVPPTRHQAEPTPLDAGEAALAAETEPEPAPADSVREALPPVQKLEPLAFSEVAPRIRGGLGAFYLQIEYPAAAREQGIQGRLVLDFTVQPDGTPTDIRLLQSLHPLCDSAAVRALRQTTFVPGRQDGEVVPVRMRLPVKFELIGQTAPADSTA